MANDNFILTAEGRAKLEEELHYLETEKRAEIGERIKVAREFGDISENSEYDDAKNEQGMVEARIAEITHILSEATVVTTPKRSTKVNIGSTVTVDMDSDERVHMVCTVTGEDSKRTSALNIPVGTYDFAIDADGDKLGLKIDVTPLEDGGTEHRFEITGLDELTDG